LCFGVIAVLTKATTFLLGQGLNVALRQWEPYVLVGVGILALVCSQSAYQPGPIAYSMPMHDLLEPSVAVVIGITALNERIPLDPRSLAIIGIGAAMACAGIVILSRSPVVHGEYLEHELDGAAIPGPSLTDTSESGGPGFHLLGRGSSRQLRSLASRRARRGNGERAP
jgi:hypothetical protein